MPLIPSSRGGQALFTSSGVPQTQMRLPSPEPLARLLASQVAGKKGQQTSDKYDLDFKALPIQKSGIHQQIMMQEMAEKAVKQEGYNRLSKEYNSNYTAFLEGEQKKGKDGYNAMLMGLRQGEIQIQTNIQIAEDNYKFFEKDMTEAQKNKALSDYIVDPNTGSRIPIGDEEGNIIGYPKVTNYFENNYESLGFDRQGNAMRYQPIDTQEAGLWNEFIHKQASLAKGSAIKTREPLGLFVKDKQGNMRLNYTKDDLMSYLVWYDITKSTNAEQLAAVMENSIRYMGREVEKDMNQEWWRFKDTNGYLITKNEIERQKDGEATDLEIKYTWMVNRIRSLIKPADQRSGEMVPRKWDMTDDSLGGRMSYTQKVIEGKVPGRQGIAIELTGHKKFGQKVVLDERYMDWSIPGDEFAAVNLEYDRSKERGQVDHPSAIRSNGIYNWYLQQDRKDQDPYYKFTTTGEQYYITENGAYNSMAYLPPDAEIVAIGKQIKTRSGAIAINMDGERRLTGYNEDVMQLFFEDNEQIPKNQKKLFREELSKPIHHIEMTVFLPTGIDKGDNPLWDFEDDLKLKKIGYKDESTIKIFVPVNTNWLTYITNNLYDKTAGRQVDTEYNYNTQSVMPDEAIIESVTID